MELTKEKLRQIRKKLEIKNPLFRDKRYLDPLSSHQKIIGREKEAGMLLAHLYSLKDGFMVPFVSVYGRSGSGKSTVVRFVCDDLTDIMCCCFVNLRKAKTIFGCINVILSELGTESVKSADGINKGIDVVSKRIEDILFTEKKRHFVLVLDECDVIFSDARGNPPDFVYKLLNMVEELRKKRLMVCVIAMSNSSLCDYTLDERIKSRMGNSEVYFPPYSGKEILEILLDRASHAFVKPVSESVIELCARQSGDEGGDCRRAIELLRKAGELAQREITIDNVKQAVKELDTDRLYLALKNATNHQRIILAAMSKLVLDNEKDWHSTSDIYLEYQNLCRELDSLSYRRVFDILGELETSGLVVAKTRSRGRHGYANEHRLTLSYDLVGYTISKEWWFEQRDDKVKFERLVRQAKEKYKEMKKLERRR